MNATVLPALAADVIAIAVLACVIYYRRHRRADLMFAYIALNTGIFTVCTLLMSQRVELAIGFGLFGVLSIIRLRSDEISQREVGYYFVALALGLVNALAQGSFGVLVGLDLLLLATMYVADHPALTGRSRRRVIVLDVVHHDDAGLRADLERRLRAPVTKIVVNEVDYVRDAMVVDVRFLADRRPEDAWPAVPARLATRWNRLGGTAAAAPGERR
ncbi:DUF4956 domain-containing protein [Streptomonospora sp. S1-112]|uniref:DUF4956 domain-containing protein n=1 Tax=Streptomonospora mangrovi TaxID=2883123 RepID=A0A9X3NSC8_9ACTN|nr:DUF4956 domain-containing protein [Streptomonospora mangrovi]MDA0563196.1 DUF4956 domain-containing protein [Streptomonospora mangrovi]